MNSDSASWAENIQTWRDNLMRKMVQLRLFWGRLGGVGGWPKYEPQMHFKLCDFLRWSALVFHKCKIPIHILDTFEPDTTHLSQIQNIWAGYKTFEPETKHLSWIQNIWAGYKTFEPGSSYTLVSKWAANTTTKKAECTQIIHNCFIYLLLHFLIQLIGEGKTIFQKRGGIIFNENKYTYSCKC